MKHLKYFSQLVNESIGRGSVLLIKGRALDSGRNLYVTTINGFSEIKPGVKMVFINDQIYRVKYREGKGFSGTPVSYDGEEGLKGIFNMRNQGIPSLVLNHNKTPFHWITLKHTDIGTALRAVGPNLFSHDTLFESQQVPNVINTEEEAKNWVIRELLSLLKGKESDHISIKGFRLDPSVLEEDPDPDDDSSKEIEWQVEIDLEFKLNEISSDIYNTLLNFNIFYELDPEIKDDKDLIELTGLNPYTTVVFNLISNVKWSHSYDSGDYYNPPSGETEIIDIETDLTEMIDLNGESVELDPRTEQELSEYSRLIDEYDADDLDSDLKMIVDSEKGEKERLKFQMIKLKHDFKIEIVSINKSEISEEEREEFSSVAKNPNSRFSDYQIKNFKKEIANLEYLYSQSLLTDDGSFAFQSIMKKRSKIKDNLSKYLELDSMGIV